MPELPEVWNLARQMHRKLKGRAIKAVEVVQPKCLNVTPVRFRSLVVGKPIKGVSARGKWIFADLAPDALLLLNLGMGGDLLYHKGDDGLPDKYQVRFDFDDGSVVTAGFWWFGYVHAVKQSERARHKMTAQLGLNPLDGKEFSWEAFSAMLAGRRGAIKPFLLDQKHVAGIGNVYVQDILWQARLHPLRNISDVSEAERRALFDAIRDNLREATKLGGLRFEKDFFGRREGIEKFLVGYREGAPCPQCGTTIEKVKTGSTASYVCPSCQR